MVKPAILKALVMLSIALLFTSCLKPKHSVRIINHCSDDFTNVVIGPSTFGTVNANATTGYMEIPEGTSTITGVDEEHPTTGLSGNLSVSGKGKHKWTLTISSSGSLSVSKDL